MLIPLYGFVQGDTLGVLVLVQHEDSVATLAATLSEAANVRVAPFVDPRVCHAGRRLAPTLTVAEAGLKPLARVDLVEGGS
jgi:toluene-4-monooxygenase system protein B